jgi:hypothetical protein
VVWLEVAIPREFNEWAPQGARRARIADLRISVRRVRPSARRARRRTSSPIDEVEAVGRVMGGVIGAEPEISYESALK